MKNTGIVRRVDELGRIVIPMGMRRTMGIETRDPMEISLNGAGEIVLTQVKDEDDLAQQISRLISSISATSHLDAGKKRNLTIILEATRQTIRGSEPAKSEAVS